VSRSSTRGLVAGLILLGISIPLALLGRATLATQTKVERALTEWPAYATVGRESDAPPLERAASSLVGAGRAEHFADAVRTYRRASSPPVFDVPPETLASELHAISGLPPGKARAQGLLMLGTLFVLATGGDGRILGGANARKESGNLIREAMNDFRTAIVMDDGNEDAKYDLEVLLRLQIAAQPAPRKAKPGRGKRRPPAGPRRAANRTLNRSELNHAGVYVAGTGY
jgi:hypothetical protein